MLLSVTQLEALEFLVNEGPRVMCWGGDIRSGKSDGAALALLTHAARYEDSDFIIAGKTAGAVTRNLVPKLRTWGKLSGAHVGKKQNPLNIDGNRFNLFGAPNRIAQDAVQGLTARGALIDEGTLIDHAFVDQCIARCDDDDAIIIITFNYENPYHWLKKEWLDQPDEFEHVFQHSTFRQAIEAGFQTEERLRFYERTLTGHRRKRWLEGQWASAEGIIWPSCIADEEFKFAGKFRRVEAGVDWGESAPTTAGFYGEWKQGHWVTLEEYWWDGGNSRTAKGHAQAIAAMGARLGCTRYVVDPSAKPLKDAMRAEGLRVVNGNNELIEGIDITEAAMSEGRMIVTPVAEQLLREAASWAWLPDVPDTPADGNDHRCDAHRYFCMDRLQVRRLTPIQKPRHL